MAIAALTAAAFSQATSLAIVWNEIGDAGGIASTAQVISGTGALVTINGSFLTGNDLDVYRFSITNTAIFSARITAVADTQISLFTGSGLGIAFNDDIGAGNTNSALSAGNALYASLSPGNYLVAVGTYSNLAATSALAAIFNTASPFTTVSGPINPGVFAGQTGGGAGFTAPVPYSIALTGAAAAVPEPGTWVMGAGLLAAAAAPLVRRKRR